MTRRQAYLHDDNIIVQYAYTILFIVFVPRILQRIIIILYYNNIVLLLYYVIRNASARRNANGNPIAIVRRIVCLRSINLRVGIRTYVRKKKKKVRSKKLKKKKTPCKRVSHKIAPRPVREYI